MAHIAASRPSPSDFGGMLRHNHTLMHEDATLPRIREQRSPSSDSAPSSNHHNEGRGDEQSASEETANDDDEEDSNAVPEDNDDTDVEPLNPSHGRGKGKGIGKRPALCIDAVDDEETLQEEADDLGALNSGFSSSKFLGRPALINKKRTFSNLSSTSVLFGDDSTDQEAFPRRKTAKKLHSGSARPLLSYEESGGDVQESAIQSDDEDYSGVNLVSDDDVTDVDVMEQEEEDYIMHEELQATVLLNEYRDAHRRMTPPAFPVDGFSGGILGYDDHVPGLPDLGFAQFFTPEIMPESPDPVVKRKFSDSSTKRVRFDDEVQASESSDSESSDLDSTVFPDLFLDQDKLPPVLHQLMEIENDDDNDFASPQSDASFWDFGHDEHKMASTGNSPNSDNDSSAGSSGYDSDMGDTTDEEDFGSDAPPRPPLHQRASILSRPSSAPGSRAGTPKPFQRSMRPTGRQLPPARGIFIHDDSTKAIAVTNRATKNVTFYRPRPAAIPWMARNGIYSSTSSTANNSPRNSIAQLNGADGDANNEVFSNAFGTDIMLSGIFGFAPGNDFVFGNQSIGPPEAFYPFVSIGTNGNMNLMDDDTYDDSEDFEDDLNITDFMDFGSDADDTDVEAFDDVSNPPTTPAASQLGLADSTPAQSTPHLQTPVRKRTASDAMLEHFDRGVVTAFRNNQDRFRDIASLPQDPSDRASLSRPVRSGKSAEAVITPLRKRSKPNRMGLKSADHNSPFKHPGSPMSGVTKATNRLQRSVLGNTGSNARRMRTFS